MPQNIFSPVLACFDFFFPKLEFYFENNFRPKKFWILAPKITTIVTLALCYDFWIFALKIYFFFQAFDWNLRRFDDQYFHRKHFMDTKTWMEIRMWNIPMCSKSSAKGCVKNKSWNFCDRSNLSGDACVASQLFLRKFEYFTIIFQSNFAQDFWRHFLFRTIKSVKMFEINTNVSFEFLHRKR